MSALLTLVAGFVLAVVAWLWSSRSLDGASRVALIAVLGVTAATFNVIVPIASIEATTTVVLCASLVLGARTGIATGLVAVVGSSVAGGIGVWTIWQIVAVALTALLGASCAALVTGTTDWFRPRPMSLLAALATVSVLAWDTITTAGSFATFAPDHVIAAVLAGAMFTLVHVVASVWLTVVGGPPLLHALARARPRLDGGKVVGVAQSPAR